MLRIPCPWCGLRDEVEFVHGGEAGRARPKLDVDDHAWARYLYFRRNPAGPLAELWYHAYGCGQWFTVTRDTVTHAIERP